jgi:hypothetical protein
MNEEALTPEGFVEKYKSGRWEIVDDPDGRCKMVKLDNKAEFLSDLNALLREELIKYEEKSHGISDHKLKSKQQ